MATRGTATLIIIIFIIIYFTHDLCDVWSNRFIIRRIKIFAKSAIS